MIINQQALADLRTSIEECLKLSAPEDAESLGNLAEEILPALMENLEALRKEYTRRLHSCPICDDGGAVSMSAVSCTYPEGGDWVSYTCLRCGYEFKDEK